MDLAKESVDGCVLPRCTRLAREGGGFCGTEVPGNPEEALRELVLHGTLLGVAESSATGRWSARWRPLWAGAEEGDGASTAGWGRSPVLRPSWGTAFSGSRRHLPGSSLKLTGAGGPGREVGGGRPEWVHWKSRCENAAYVGRLVSNYDKVLLPPVMAQLGGLSIRLNHMKFHHVRHRSGDFI